MTTSRSPVHRLGVAVAGLAALGWLVMTLARDPAPFELADARSYWTEANAVVDHGELRESFDTGTTPATWRPPLYGGWLAGLVGLGAGPGAAVRVNQLLLLAAAGLLYVCARKLGIGRGGGVAVALLYLWYPTANRLAAALMSESLFAVLALAALAVALSGDPAGSRRREAARLLACGLLAGLAILCRTVGYAWLPGLALLALAGPRPLGRRSGAALLAAGLVVALTPWTVRNLHLHGRLVVVNTSGAYNLWLGNVVDANGVRDPGTRAWLAELRGSRSEVEVADELEARAWAAVRDRPGAAVARWTRNGLALWSTTRGASGSQLVDQALLIAQVAALLAAALALWLEPRRRALWALATIPALTTGIHALTFVEWRFALPLIPATLLIAAAGLGRLPRLRAGAC